MLINFIDVYISTAINTLASLGAGYILQLWSDGAMHSRFGKLSPHIKKYFPALFKSTSLVQGGSVQQLKSRGVALGCVRTLVVVAEERPRIALCNR